MPFQADTTATDTTAIGRTVGHDTMTTATTDSISSLVETLPWDTIVCRETEAPLSAADKEIYHSLHSTYLSGIAPEPRQPRAATDSGILSLLTLTFLLVAFNFKHCARLFGVMAADMWSVRRRANAFDDTTANETRVLIVLLLQLWVCEGLLICAALTHFNIMPPAASFVPIAVMAGVSCGFYVAQLLIYKVIGYLFTDPIGTSQWLKGFNSTQAFLGAALMIPALVTIFYPIDATPMLWLAAGLYAAARIMFIIKGFRIFYHNFASLLYFILYLCALELVPLILAASLVTYLGHAMA